MWYDTLTSLCATARATTIAAVSLLRGTPIFQWLKSIKISHWKFRAVKTQHTKLHSMFGCQSAKSRGLLDVNLKKVCNHSTSPPSLWTRQQTAKMKKIPLATLYAPGESTQRCCKHQNNFRCRVDVNRYFTSHRLLSPLHVVTTSPATSHSSLSRKMSLSSVFTAHRWLMVDGFDSLSAPNHLCCFFLLLHVSSVTVVQTSARNRQHFDWQLNGRARSLLHTVMSDGEEWWRRTTERREYGDELKLKTWRNKYFLTTHHCHHSSQHVCFARYTRCGE